MLDDKVKIHFEVEQLLYIEYMAQQNKKKMHNYIYRYKFVVLK